MNIEDLRRTVMARNVVQFQKGLSEPAFDRQYGTEEQCRAVVIGLRWPDGFRCPACGGREHSMVTTRDLFQCRACRRQTSPIAGTIFASTKLTLRTWFRAIYHLTQSKQGISSIELGRRLGVTQTTAWTVKHKLKQVMMERNATKPLTGRVEIDDAYLGGERSGGKLAETRSVCGWGEAHQARRRSSLPSRRRRRASRFASSSAASQASAVHPSPALPSAASIPD